MDEVLLPDLGFFGNCASEPSPGGQTPPFPGLSPLSLSPPCTCHPSHPAAQPFPMDGGRVSPVLFLEGGLLAVTTLMAGLPMGFSFRKVTSVFGRFQPRLFFS